ncbi:MAG: protein kinase family protein [Nocardioides sp.]|uniref:protein kinase family protein n=1 Tax=Nocardioides sp. TaxID=35761 RepID=UPI003263BE6E
MPDSLHAGDLLAKRYRLDELLTESAGGRFWRAHDLVLDRHVAVHIIASADERADGLLDAARRTAPHHDRRLLRVLDADRTEELCYVVNEWGAGTSLDIMLADSGPLAPRRAAWIVSEVADSLARAHDAGLQHGRMVPENVLIDRQGQVRIIGFAVDAALHGVPLERQRADLIDTVAVLYAALTGKWAGPSMSLLPPAPRLHGEVLRPRRVRAGIPRPLDALCDQVINPTSGHHQRTAHDLATLTGIAAALADFVGDPTGMAEGGSWTEPAATQPVRRIEPLSAPAPAPPPSPVEPTPPPPAPEPEPEPEPTPEPDPEQTVAPVELPTQAGIPVFDENDGVGWIPTRSDAPAPPPPFEDKPVKPLFAPEPPEGEPVRRPRPGTTAAQSPDYWPWESTGPSSSSGSGIWPPAELTDTGSDVVPGRNWIRLAMALGVGVLVLVAAVAAYHLGSGDPDEPEEDAASTKPSAAAALTPFTGLTATDFDPQGSAPQEENPELVPLVLDGDPATSWRTASYLQDFGPTGLKDGVGLVLDLGAAKGVREIDIATLGGPTELSVYLTTTAPTGIADLTPVGTAAGNGGLTVTLDEAVSGRFVTVWLTSIPPVEGEFRGTIADVVVKG